MCILRYCGWRKSVIFAQSNSNQPLNGPTMMTMIAYTTLLIAALFDLTVMLRWDINALRENDFSSSSYNTWLRKSGELSSLKRLLVLAVLIATCTTMAQTSWIVVMILAAGLIIQSATMLFTRQEPPINFNRRAWLTLAIAIILALLAISTAFYLGNLTNEIDATHAAAITTVMILAISPLLTMLANCLLIPFYENGANPANDDKENN